MTGDAQLTNTYSLQSGARKQRQMFAAACDIGGGLFYTIETEWIWRKEELTLEALVDFLKIRVE